MLDKSIKDLSVVDVTTAVTELKSYYRKRNDGIKKGVELYRRQERLKVPSGIVEVIAHTATTICDRGADRVGSARIQAHMEPRRPGKTESQHVEALEKASSALFYMSRKRAKYNPVRAWGLHGFNRGAIVAKFQLDTEAMTPKPERSEFATEVAFKKAVKVWMYRQVARFPLVIDARPIEAIYPDPETDGDRFVVEHYKRKWGDIKKNYPRAAEVFGDVFQAPPDKNGAQKTYRDDELVEFTEVWTQDYRCVVIEGQFCPIGDFPAGPVPNLFGRPPYFIRYPFGDPTGPPEERCVNILRAVSDELMMESRMLTVVQAVAETGAYGATVIDADDSAAESTIAFGPGAVVKSDKLKEGGGPRPLIQQNRLGDALQALGVAQTAASEGAVPSEARGAPSPARTGQPSGVAAAILTGQASMVVAPVKDAIEDLISDLLPFAFFVLDTVFGETLTLYAQVGKDQFVNVTLDSKTIDEHYGPVYVTLKLQTPESDASLMNSGIQAAQTGKFPDEWVLETFFGVENAAAMLEDAHAQRIAESDEVNAYLKQRLIERLQAKASGSADQLPGQSVSAPADAPAPPPPQVPASGMAGPPLSPMERAGQGFAQAGPGGAGLVAPMLPS